MATIHLVTIVSTLYTFPPSSVPYCHHYRGSLSVIASVLQQYNAGTRSVCLL